ncbi:MAG: flagellar hook protein FlgE [Blastocatellia bacterium]
MPFSFGTALSGLRASSDSLSVSGNNIANSNTTAFKSSDITFADVFTSSTGVRLNGAGGAVQVGNGVRVAATHTNFNQGTLNDTGIPTNAAIEGKGYFVVADPGGKQSFTRAGDFTLDRSGYIVTPNGYQLQGYAAVNGVITPGAAITTLKVPLGETLAPVVTTEATLRLNLDASDPAAAVFHAPVQVYDTKGAVHTLDMTFTKQANGSWDMVATLDGNAAQASADGGAAAATPVNFTFDSSGKLTSPNTLSIIPDQTKLNGASLPSVAINLRQPGVAGAPGAPNITNYSAPSGVASIDQDGFAAGDLTGISMSGDRTGIVEAVFSNGQRRPLGQIAIASFNDENGLQRLGNNLYGDTLSSGQPSIGTAGSGGRGDVVGSALEQSNVDLASEFTKLIVAQRSFQANSRVINAISQTLQDLLQVA